MDFKRINIYIFLFGIIFLCSCESDDVCDSTIPTTPSLVIEFYDATNTSTLKTTTNLKITEVGNTVALVSDQNVTKLKIPLKSNAIIVKYEFASNANVLTGGIINPAINKDIVTFNYTTKDVYISRACGYKTTFELNDFNYTNNVADAPLENSKWIKNVQLLTKIIDNETQVHLKIFF
jgi:Family of unknown function (DUF6452)